MSARREASSPLGKLVAYFFQLVARLKIALAPTVRKGLGYPATSKSSCPAGAFFAWAAKNAGSVAFLFLALATFAPAQWIEKNSGDESSFDGRVVHRHVDLAETQTDNRAMVDLALFSAKSSKLRVIDNADGVTLSDAVQRHELHCRN